MRIIKFSFHAPKDYFLFKLNEKFHEGYKVSGINLLVSVML